MSESKVEEKNILVTGGAGFIGSHLVEALVAEGNEVTVLDNLSAGENNVRLLERLGAKLHNGDIRDFQTVFEAVQGCDAIFHLAAMNRAMRSILEPIEANEVNVTGTLNVLEAARNKGVNRIVFASSSSVYASGGGKRDESFPRAPRHPYGVGKLAGEEYCRIYGELYGLKTTTLRYASVYGPRQRGDIDYAAVIPKLVERQLKGQELPIYGTGKQTRQFTYVKDTVEGTIKAWKSPHAIGEAFNIASPEEVSVLGIATALEGITGRKAKVKHLDPLPSDPAKFTLDVTKAEKMLKFKAQTTFEAGLAATVSYFAGKGEKEAK